MVMPHDKVATFMTD